MKSRLDLCDVEFDIPPVVLFERRRRPDRRSSWRGGRRDSDWIARPIGGLERFQRAQRTELWRRWTRS